MSSGDGEPHPAEEFLHLSCSADFPDDELLPGFDMVFIHGRRPSGHLEMRWRRESARELEFPDALRSSPANGTPRGGDGA